MLGKHALNIIEPEMKVLELCEKLENLILSLGAKPAFPVNVSINDVAAHYTAKINDDLVIPRDGVIKIDVGAHIDGYIADAAITINFNPVYDRLVKASLKALEEVSKTLKPGKTLGEIGQVIEKTIKSYGFKPIENLTGHLVKRYELHAGKSVPNIDNGDRKRIIEGEVYAIEPFATNGKGYVVDSNEITIYRVLSTKVKDKELIMIMNYIVNEFKTLPFTPRWLIPKFGNQVLVKIQKLHADNKIYGYPVLVEAGRGFVSQFEDTFVITEKDTEQLVNTLELVR